MSISQAEFNQFVRTFNSDYQTLLERAALTPFNANLVRWFRSLKDGYQVILTIHDTQNVDYEIPLRPLIDTGSTELLSAWVFNDPQIAQITAFLDHVRAQPEPAVDDTALTNEDLASQERRK
jgi:hypothetical protein